MKKCISMVCAFILAVLAIMVVIAPSEKGAAVSGRVTRVGLYYGSNALPSANLANEAGRGYSFGYFDSQDTFIKVGETELEKITIIKDKLMYYGGGVFSEYSSSEQNVGIGAYHIQLPDVYYSFSEAAAAAAYYADGSAFEYAFPVYSQGNYYVRLDHFSSRENASSMLGSAPAGAYVTGGSDTCYTVVSTFSGKIIFEFDSGKGAYLALRPTPYNTERCTTWFKNRLYHGDFEYKRMAGNDLTVINVADVDDYVAGVIPYEMSASWPVEALKAQAVCARTYAVCNKDKHKILGFDICSGTDCQVYRGIYTGDYSSSVRQACLETSGQCVYYGSEPAVTYYFSSDGGSTESAANVWGTEVPYLQAVADPFEELSVGNNGIWSATFTRDELTAMVRDWGYSCSEITDVFVKERTAADNVHVVVFRDEDGKEYSFTGDEARTVFTLSGSSRGANSIRYTISGGSGGYSDVFIKSSGSVTGAGGKISVISADGSVRQADISGSSVMTGSGMATLSGTVTSSGSSDSFTLNGTGWGHNVGMSQYGAKGMAEQGYKYDEIIKYYYTGVTVR